jgi:ketosteroid isomerase-like protein
MSRENVEVVAEVYADWERGDFKTGTGLFDRHATLVIDSGIPDGGVFVGQEGIRTYMLRFLEAWESLTITANSLRPVGDSVLAEVRQLGHGQGSGVAVEHDYFQLWTFRGGRVVRLETILSESEALEAVGLRE